MGYERKYAIGVLCAVAAAMTLSAVSRVSAEPGAKHEPPRPQPVVKCAAMGESVSFSGEDFEEGGDSALSGVIISALPETEEGTLVFEGMEVRTGKVIPAGSLGSLTFLPASPDRPARTEFKVIPIFAATGAAAESVTVTLSLEDGENTAPVARELSFETYRDLPLTGRLEAFDPEKSICSFEITGEPRYGTVSLEGDVFNYRPATDKAKSDSFTFRARDERGAVSEDARVTVKLLPRPEGESLSYTDMAGVIGHYAAVRLAEAGVMRGETLGAGSFLYPHEPVTRAQLVSVVIKACELPLSASATVTGMGDNDDIPAWAKPCVAAALAGQIVTGERSDTGNRVFRANDSVTRAEAAVILSRAAGLSEDGREADFADAAAVPDWALGSVVNAVSAGIMELDGSGRFSPDGALTRREAVLAVFRTMEATRAKSAGFFSLFR